MVDKEKRYPYRYPDRIAGGTETEAVVDKEKRYLYRYHDRIAEGEEETKTAT